MLAADFVSHRFTDPLSIITESGKGRGESDGGDIEYLSPHPDSLIPVSRFRVKGSGIRVQLLGICFWRKVREERIWAEYMGEKGDVFNPFNFAHSRIAFYFSNNPKEGGISA